MTSSPILFYYSLSHIRFSRVSKTEEKKEENFTSPLLLNIICP